MSSAVSFKFTCYNRELLNRFHCAIYSQRVCFICVCSVELFIIAVIIIISITIIVVVVCFKGLNSACFEIRPHLSLTLLTSLSPFDQYSPIRTVSEDGQNSFSPLVISRNCHNIVNLTWIANIRNPCLSTFWYFILSFKPSTLHSKKEFNFCCFNFNFIFLH